MNFEQAFIDELEKIAGMCGSGGAYMGKKKKPMKKMAKLIGNQARIDLNKNKRIDSQDLAMLRGMRRK